MVAVYLSLQGRSFHQFRRPQEDPAVDIQGSPVVFSTTYLSWSDGKDGTVPHQDRFCSIGQILRKLLLNEKAVNPVTVKAAAERRNFIVADKRQLRMQYRGTYILGVDVGIIDLQYLLHSATKIVKSAKLV